jgi:hypothetical protein
LASAQCHCLALLKYISSQRPIPIAPFNTMPLHDLYEIKQKTEFLLSSIVEIISDLERDPVSTDSLSQLPTSAKRNVRTKSITHNPEVQQPICDQLDATLSSIICEASRLRNVLKPSGGTGLTAALREESATSDQHATRTAATAPRTRITPEDSTPIQTNLAAALPSTGLDDTCPNGQVSGRETTEKERSKPAVALEPPDLSGSAAVGETEQTTAVKEDGERQHQSKEAKTLHYTCEAADLGPKMTDTIAKAMAALGEEHVTGYGYLLLDVKSLPAVDWAEVSQDATTPPRDEIVGFSYVKGTQGVAHSFCASRKLEFVFPDFSGPAPCAPHVDPEQDFQDTIDHPPSGDLAYYVGVPLGSLPCTDLVHPGNKLKERGNGKLLGINTPYWYISTCHGTPANLHVEDGRTGSVNLLLAGAPKDWLFVHQPSKAKFEASLREEFPDCKACSQFARHLNILLAPSWLRERGIEYSVVRQYPGQMVVTLHDAYHQVKNTGKNFAVAINFELSQWPDEPMNYTWCRRGLRNCGQNALTMEDFQRSSNYRTAARPQSKRSSLNIRQKKADTDESLDELFDKVLNEVPDEVPDEVPPKDIPITHLPPEDPKPLQDIKNLIAFCLAENLSPHLLGCASVEDMEQKLGRFLPGAWLDDGLLRVLLQVLGSSDQFVVVESIDLELGMPEKSAAFRLSTDTRGLIFPFHVNDCEQGSAKAPKNHWVLGVFDQRIMQFTSFGVEAALTARWASVLEIKMKDVLKEDCKIRPEARAVCPLCVVHSPS